MDVIKQALDKAVEQGKLDKEKVPKKYQGEPSTPSPKPDDIEILPSDVLPSEPVEPELPQVMQAQFRSVMNFARKYIPIHELSQEELDSMINVYPKWDMQKDGTELKEGNYYQYNGDLYEVIKGKTHNKQSDWTPDVTASLFNKIVPDGVVAEWEQRSGHNPYMKGDKVLWKGNVWESVIDNNSWSPEGYPQGWKEV